MSCKLCGYAGTNGLSREHTFCPSCKGHEYQGVLVDAKAWDAWMEGGEPPPEIKEVA